MRSNFDLRNTLIITGIAFLFFGFFNGRVHLFDWDEINFAEMAREMVVTGEYLRPQVNFTFFTEKPPMFMWMQAASMEVMGVGEYAARFPNVVAGILTLILLFHFGKKLYNVRFGWLWVLTYIGSVLPHLYFRSGIIDPWFNLFIFLGIFHLILFTWKKNNTAHIELYRSKFFYLVVAGIFTGLAMLVKGPVAYLITGLTLGVYWIFKRFRFYISPLEFIGYTVVAILTAMTWFGLITIFHGTQFVEEFTIRQWEIFSREDAGHGGFPGYHFVVLLIGVFPASIFVLRSFGRQEFKFDYLKDYKLWMLILFWVVLILFTIVRSKIVHYSSMAYFPMTFLAAMVLHDIMEGRLYFRRWMALLLMVFAFVFGAVLIALPWLGKNVDIIRPLFAADPFAMANLDAKVPWTGWESLAGVWFILITITAVIRFYKGKFGSGVVWLFGGTAIFVFLTLSLVIKKIEMISQNAAIEFFESKAGCDCYVTTENYKSYGQYFYAQSMPGGDHRRYDNQWLKYGDIDRETFFVAKITGSQELEKAEDIDFLYEKNGFTFWVRHPISK